VLIQPDYRGNLRSVPPPSWEQPQQPAAPREASYSHVETVPLGQGRVGTPPGYKPRTGLARELGARMGLTAAQMSIPPKQTLMDEIAAHLDLTESERARLDALKRGG
jgi:hypothetical protein